VAGLGNSPPVCVRANRYSIILQQYLSLFPLNASAKRQSNQFLSEGVVSGDLKRKFTALRGCNLSIAATVVLGRKFLIIIAVP
jgi:hypothetical protein